MPAAASAGPAPSTQHQGGRMQEVTSDKYIPAHHQPHNTRPLSPAAGRQSSCWSPLLFRLHAASNAIHLDLTQLVLAGGLWMGAVCRKPTRTGRRPA